MMTHACQDWSQMQVEPHNQPEMEALQPRLAVEAQAKLHRRQREGQQPLSPSWRKQKSSIPWALW